MEQRSIRVRFLNERREFHIPDGGLPLAAGDLVIVETEGGLDCCEVAAGPEGCPLCERDTSEAAVLRKATPNDVEWLATKRQTEEAAADACGALARKMDLNMRLAAVKMTFDGSKIVFFFTADQRVDFRALVRELAKRFRTRIEMRQIGVRDKAKHIGGIGVCGRPLCCTTFLQGFEPVTMKMAKEQNLTLSPSKISGYCGRLMCCLAYENEFYHGVRSGFPPVGARVRTREGDGEVRAVLFLVDAVVVTLDSGVVFKAPRADIKMLAPPAGKQGSGKAAAARREEAFEELE